MEGQKAYTCFSDFEDFCIKKLSTQLTLLYSIKNFLKKQIISVVYFLPIQIANFINECLVLGITNKIKEVMFLQSEKKQLTV